MASTALVHDQRQSSSSGAQTEGRLARGPTAPPTQERTLKAAWNPVALQVMIAGYPADKSSGECDVSTCMVSYKCSADSTQH